MNELNYGSLEACQRLVDAGIVVPAEFWWSDSKGVGKWDIHNRVFIKGLYGIDVDNIPVEFQSRFIPALSMAEAWRELKARGQFPCSDGDNFWLYDNNDADDISPEISDPNPTDALISLIIWTRKEGKDG